MSGFLLHEDDFPYAVRSDIHAVHQTLVFFFVCTTVTVFDMPLEQVVKCYDNGDPSSIMWPGNDAGRKLFLK